ncbi:helix-turn-helix domain-containing protein [Pontimicrobium sp. MEBiC06410]
MHTSLAMFQKQKEIILDLDSTNTFINIVDVVGIIQGVLFGLMFIILNSKKEKKKYFAYLGGFILLFSLEPIPSLLYSLDILNQYPYLELFPAHFHFSAFPLFYLYIQKISILKTKKTNYWVLIPGFVEFVIGIFIFIQPIPIKLSLKPFYYSMEYYAFGLLYSIFIGIKTLNLIKKHQVEIKNQYTYLLDKQLNWCKWFLYASILFQVILLIDGFTIHSFWYILSNVSNLILIYWICFKGFTQHSINSVLDDFKSLDLNYREKGLLPYENSKPELYVAEDTIEDDEKTYEYMDHKEMNNILKKVDAYLVESEVYINKDFALNNLSNAINVHPRRVSFSLNKLTGYNFNTYINKYRIDKAKAILKNPLKDHLSIEGVGIEVGFNSRASFYSAFKKFEKSTPAMYKKKRQD